MELASDDAYRPRSPAGIGAKLEIAAPDFPEVGEALRGVAYGDP